MKFGIALGAFILAEAVTIYAYSWLFLLEGEPRRHDDSRLQLWAWIYMAAMLLELAAFLFWLGFLRRSIESSPADSQPFG